MGIFGKVAGIAKELTLGHPTIRAGRYIGKKLFQTDKIRKKRNSSTSRTSADVTLRRRKAAEAKYDKGQYERKHDKGQYKAKMMKMKSKAKSKRKYKGMKGMKYSGKNKPVTSIADRMQARRRRTAKKKK